MFKVEKDYNEYQNKTFRIPSEIVKELEVVASKNNISVNRLVIQCLQYSLDNLDENSK
ncbi:MAG: toxin-antitoxin system HicB family antitoxin [Lachnospiraceae bacterium]|nr:toxin-antitoxin system HicB family antitoxin [Lachnospiraceae bacterium]